jgi:diacylglycerol kinase family enzyme
MNIDSPVEVIATSISGSVKDWGKVNRIIPLFHEHGMEQVRLTVVDTHSAARTKACEVARGGVRILISAGGSGTFNAVVEGCYDAGVDLDPLRLGFLRKGSADLIGKVLGMPDEITEAVGTFVEAIRQDRSTPCDVLLASSELGQAAPRHFVGYGGTEIFGEIPYFTENRYIKYYKGILGQLFGDLGPFFTGMSLVLLRRLLVPRWRSRRVWKVVVDGRTVAVGRFQAMVVANGDLGPNLPLARGVPLGSGDFHLFAIRNLGARRLPRQLRAAWNASILDHPALYGLESFRIMRRLELRPQESAPFPLNADGSILECRGAALVERVGRLHFLSGVAGKGPAGSGPNQE